MTRLRHPAPARRPNTHEIKPTVTPGRPLPPFTAPPLSAALETEITIERDTALFSARYRQASAKAGIKSSHDRARPRAIAQDVSCLQPKHPAQGEIVSKFSPIRIFFASPEQVPGWRTGLHMS